MRMDCDGAEGGIVGVLMQTAMGTSCGHKHTHTFCGTTGPWATLRSQSLEGKRLTNLLTQGSNNPPKSALTTELSSLRPSGPSGFFAVHRAY